MFLHFLQSVCQSLLVAGVSLRASHIKDASSGQLASGLRVPWPSVGAGKRGVHGFDLLGSLWRSWQPVLKKVKTNDLGPRVYFTVFFFDKWKCACLCVVINLFLVFCEWNFPHHKTELLKKKKNTRSMPIYHVKVWVENWQKLKPNNFLIHYDNGIRRSDCAHHKPFCVFCVFCAMAASLLLLCIVANICEKDLHTSWQESPRSFKSLGRLHWETSSLSWWQWLS